MCAWANRFLKPVIFGALWYMVTPFIGFSTIGFSAMSEPLPDLMTQLSCTHLSYGLAEERDQLLQPGDVLRVIVWGEPELSFDRVVIGSDGALRLPLIGTVMLANQRLPEVEAILMQRYRDYLRQPKVSLTRINLLQ